MTRLFGLLVVGVLAAGCASLTPAATPSPAPSATADPSPSPAAPSVAPSSSPEASASVAPVSAAPSVAPESPSGSAYDQLLAHIPVAMRADCREVTSFDTGVVVGIQCINIPSVDGYVSYYQFDSGTNMNAAYQSDVEFLGSEATGASCQVQASELGYTIDGVPAGRLMCADFENGLIALWTHDGFAINSGIVLFEGTYPDIYAAWLVAGPDPAGAVPSPSPAQAVTWSTTASEHGDAVGQRFDYQCPPGGPAGVIWGTDIYTDDSSVCTAGVHAGLITLASGGGVTIEMRPGQDSYPGTERNGITSSDWGTWDGSFVFVTP